MKLYLLAILFLAACSKPVPPEQVQSAPVQKPTPQQVSAPTTDGPTTQLEKMGAVKMVKVRAPNTSSAEAAAYRKAFKNAKLANKLLGEHKYRVSFKDKAPRV